MGLVSDRNSAHRQNVVGLFGLQQLLGDLLLDNVGTRLAPLAASALRVLEKMPPWKMAMANQTIRSRFVSTMLGWVEKQATKN